MLEPQIRRLVERSGLPPTDARATLLFSATFSNEMKRVAEAYLRQPYARVEVGRVGSSTSAIEQRLVLASDGSRKAKLELLLPLVDGAERWFGFSRAGVDVTVGDGLTAFDDESEADVVVIDVDAKDASLGMSCPPAAFLAPAYLQKVKRTLRPGGVCVVNIVARSEKAFSKAMVDLRSTNPPTMIFPSLAPRVRLFFGFLNLMVSS